MLKFKRADYDGVYHNFNIKEGFWYGVNTKTNLPIATSGWYNEDTGELAVYNLIGDQWWAMSWEHYEDTVIQFALDEYRENAKDKLPFREWIEKMGYSHIDGEEPFDESEYFEEYDRYLYGVDLSEYVRKYFI